MTVMPNYPDWARQGPAWVYECPNGHQKLRESPALGRLFCLECPPDVHVPMTCTEDPTQPPDGT